MLVDHAYEAWKQAPAEQKEARLSDLYRAIENYSDRLIGKLKGDHIPELGADVASFVLTHLDDFRGSCPSYCYSRPERPRERSERRGLAEPSTEHLLWLSAETMP